jgi:hypothetical protein
MNKHTRKFQFNSYRKFFSYLTDKRRPDTLSEFLLGFLNVIITAIVCLAPVVTVKPPGHAACDATLAELRVERQDSVYRSSRKETPRCINT